jgi:hypothetical protein
MIQIDIIQMEICVCNQRQWHVKQEVMKMQIIQKVWSDLQLGMKQIIFGKRKYVHLILVNQDIMKMQNMHV